MIKRAAAAVIVLALMAVPAHSSDCPADKPMKRTVTQYPTMLTCTLVACSPKLVCPEGSTRCHHVAVDCNRCTPQPFDVEICLSQDDLDKAK